MSVNGKVEVVTQIRQTDPPRDFTTNTLYFSTDAAVGAGDWQELTDMVKVCFFSTTGTHFLLNVGRGGTIKAYNLADPKPRPVQATSSYVPSTWSTAALGPREVAVCLSYFANRNLPRQRGRIYLGPFDTSMSGDERPSATINTHLSRLANDLKNLPPALSPSWFHSTHSTVTDQTLTVTNWWFNDLWDTMRSRLPKELARTNIS